MHPLVEYSSIVEYSSSDEDEPSGGLVPHHEVVRVAHHDVVGVVPHDDDVGVFEEDWWDSPQTVLFPHFEDDNEDNEESVPAEFDIHHRPECQELVVTHSPRSVLSEGKIGSYSQETIGENKNKKKIEGESELENKSKKLIKEEEGPFWLPPRDSHLGSLLEVFDDEFAADFEDCLDEDFLRVCVTTAMVDDATDLQEVAIRLMLITSPRQLVRLWLEIISETDIVDPAANLAIALATTKMCPTLFDMGLSYIMLKAAEWTTRQRNRLATFFAQIIHEGAIKLGDSDALRFSESSPVAKRTLIGNIVKNLAVLMPDKEGLRVFVAAHVCDPTNQALMRLLSKASGVSFASDFDAV